MLQQLSRPTVLSLAGLAVVVGLAAGVGGCALPGKVRGLTNLSVDPNSPVAKDVLYASRHPGPYPHFTDIPEVPTDVRPVSEWRTAVLDLKQRKAVLDTQVAALPPVRTDTEAYAATHRAKAGVQPSEIPPLDAAQLTQSYAQSLRERATPPPPPR